MILGTHCDCCATVASMIEGTYYTVKHTRLSYAIAGPKRHEEIHELRAGYGKIFISIQRFFARTLKKSAFGQS